MSILRCLENAAGVGLISRDEADALRQRYQGMLRDGVNDGEARARLQQQIAKEAENRERAALLTNVAIDKLLIELSRYRNWKGEPDEAEAFIQILENFGHNGTFIQDVEGRRDAIFRSAMEDLKDLLKEGRRGAITGDMRRAWNPKVKTRMDNIVREVSGVDTGDAKAKAIAKAWDQVAEGLRQRFNDAGGAIGKLQGGYIPQSHDRLALIDFKKGPWIEYMMEPGRLDRDRMVSSLTGQKLTDSELREALDVAWNRITTDGYWDADISAAPQGMGALYTQHADHRFIHFKTPEAWIEYSRRFGNGGDVFAAMMNHVSIMSRDIAQMEVLGPNPNRTRNYIKQAIITRASKLKSNDAVLAEQKARFDELTARLNITNPDLVKIRDKLWDIHRAIDEEMRNVNLMWRNQPRSLWPERVDRKLRELDAQRERLEVELLRFYQGFRPFKVEDEAVKAEITHLLEEMRVADTDLRGEVRGDPDMRIGMRDGDREVARINKKLARADAMWDMMRGNMTPDPVLAARFQSVRNMITAGALGSAVISSLTDPAFGQDVRLRMGMGLKESGFLRIAMANIKELITMGTREDAIAAGLGIDSAARVLHRAASEIKGIDHQFWSGYFADRVLTTGLLSPWTQAGKHVFGLDLMRYTAKLSDKTWGELPEGLQLAWSSHGFDAQSWDKLRAMPKHQGVFIRPTEVIDADRMLGERYLQMIMRETRYAVPEATVRSASLVTGGQAGTLMGEAMRSAMQFKGFAIGVMMLHHARVARDLRVGDARDRAWAAGYAATLLITSTGLGMFALALKDIKDGRDPRKWLDEKTWLDRFYILEGMLQAGGLGIFGDFLRASENRLGGGLAGTVAGPLVGKIENLIGVGNAMVKAGAGRGGPNERTPQEEAVRFFRSGVVPGSNHWALAMLYQRKLMDNLQRMVDPDAQKAFNRQISTRMKDYNQQFYWRPGAPTWDRGPDVSRAWATR